MEQSSLEKLFYKRDYRYTNGLIDLVHVYQVLQIVQCTVHVGVPLKARSTLVHLWIFSYVDNQGMQDW